jgi:hypothetical protein
LQAVAAFRIHDEEALGMLTEVGGAGSVGAHTGYPTSILSRPRETSGR